MEGSMSGLLLKPVLPYGGLPAIRIEVRDDVISLWRDDTLLAEGDHAVLCALKVLATLDEKPPVIVR